MTRFARASKKTSLEATPWHELVNSGGDNSSKAKGKATSQDTHSVAGNKVKMAGKKRKKNYIVDEGNMKPKKSGKLEDKKEHSRVVEEGDNEHVGTALQKKDTTKPWKKKFNVSKDSKQIKTKKRLGALKNVEMHKVKSPSNANRTETLDKKHEARRKRRAKGKACFHCRQTGHLVSECPLTQGAEMGVGNCYKCGSSEHTTKNCVSKSADAATFPFAKCFICGENGHITRACPDNPKGLYPNGGGCKICGSVEHFRRNCPELAKQTKGSSTTLLIQNMRNKKGHFSADAELEDDEGTSHKAPKKKGPNVVKF